MISERVVQSPRIGLRKTVSWTLVSTATSSLGSFLLSYAMLRSSSTVSFAFFGIFFTFYALILNINRAVTGSPTILLHSGQASQEASIACSAAVRNSVYLGLAAAAIGASIAIGCAGDHSAVLLVGMAFLPGLLAQDTARYVYFARQDPRGAALADIIWTGLQCVLFTALFLSGATRPTLFLISWGFAGCIAAVAMIRVAGLRLLVRDGGVARLWRERSIIAPLLVEMGALGSADFAASLVIAAVGTTAMLGTYRASVLLMGPFNLLLASMVLSVVPRGVSDRRSGIDFRPALRRTAIALTAGAALWIAFLGALPMHVGLKLFGSQWPSVHALLPAWLFALCAVALSTVAFSALRILTRLTAAMAARVISVPVLLGAIAAGVVVAGAKGAVVGYGAGFAVAGLAALLLLRSSPS